MTELHGHKSEEQEAYDYTIKDFDTCLSCPVCRAIELDKGIGEVTSYYMKGQKKACTVVFALGKHECAEHKGLKQAEVKEKNEL